MHRYSDSGAACELRHEVLRRRSVVVLAPVRAAPTRWRWKRAARPGGVRRFAFREFVIELSAAELNRRGLVPVGRFVREALAARVTAEALHRGELTYLRPVAGFPGFPRALTATFEELRLNAVDPERLRGCGQSGPDLARLLEAIRASFRAAICRPRRACRSGARRLLRRLQQPPPDGRGRARSRAPDAPERELLASVMRAARVTLELRLESGGASAQDWQANECPPRSTRYSDICSPATRSRCARRMAAS